MQLCLYIFCLFDFVLFILVCLQSSAVLFSFVVIYVVCKQGRHYKQEHLPTAVSDRRDSQLSRVAVILDIFYKRINILLDDYCC